MPTKKQSRPTTTIRNGVLFCFNCGKTFDPQLPQAIDFYVALLKLFDKHHKNCPKTFVMPVVDQSLSEKEKAQWWREGINGERGTSSEFMWRILFYYDNAVPGSLATAPHPHDPDDFKRCYLLLQTVPEWKDKLHLMKDVSPVWSKLVDNWNLFTELLEEQLRGKQNDLYTLMQEIGC